MTQSQNDSIKKKSSQSSRNSTQLYMQIAGIHDQTLVLKNGGLRAILEISPLNFNLKSTKEQEAIISSYQNFLNALNFPIQILVRSRKIEIDEYVDKLKIKKDALQNDLLKESLENHILFLQDLVQYNNIMEKRFFLVIPMNPSRSESKGLISSFLQYINPEDTVLNVLKRKKEFASLKKMLDLRVESAKTALESCGVSVHQLSNEKIIEIFYQHYNPETSRIQKLDFEKMVVS